MKENENLPRACFLHALAGFHAPCFLFDKQES